MCVLLDAIWNNDALLASPRWGHSSLLEHPCTGLSEKTPTDDDDGTDRYIWMRIEMT